MNETGSADRAGSLETARRVDWTLVADLAQAVGALAVAGSVLIAGYSYGVSRADRNVDRTFTYLDRFDAERLEEARRDVDALVAQADQFVLNYSERHAAADAGELSAEAKDQLFVNDLLARSDTQGEDLPSAVLEILSFFGGLQICIEENKCDAATAHAFLDTYAQSFWRQLGPAVEFSRARDRPSAGRKMEDFVKGVKG